ncbi:MAG: polyprenyl synthetase family protein [Candidatus Eutrophobiaceae bacterium]
MAQQTSTQEIDQYLSDKLAFYQERVHKTLDRSLPDESKPPIRLHKAMRHSVLGGGKRVRAILVYAAGEAMGASVEELDIPAATVELIHAYSLIHDDLPAMDNDDLRRGEPSCHCIYGEDAAILAGDALQALAFEVLVSDTPSQVPAETRLKMVRTLAAASGVQGMASGQMIDLDAVGKILDIEALQWMHTLKTGRLIQASAVLGAMTSNQCDASVIDAFANYGIYLGLAFQVKDDILDVECDTEVLGKPQGSDEAHNKPTYPSLLGLEKARQQALEFRQQAVASLAKIGRDTELLRKFADYVVLRKK